VKEDAMSALFQRILVPIDFSSEAVMAGTRIRSGRWWQFAERGMLRIVMILIGLVLMIVGLGLGVTMIMLPAGVVIGLLGVGLLVWGAVGDMPQER
jgi:hypothetical protein